MRADLDSRLRHGQSALGAEGVRGGGCVGAGDRHAGSDRPCRLALVVPGVGAFRDAIDALHRWSLAEAIVRHIKRGRAFLGICLGMQLLFDVSHEDGTHAGLGVLRGRVDRFDVDRTDRLKVPHTGWNQLAFRSPRSPLFRDLDDGCSVYFVHSYHVVPHDVSVIAATTDYGRPFVSAVWRDNLHAVQFHPEKSQKVGLKMLANFAVMSGADAAI